MATAADFKITLYDMAGNRVGWTGNFVSLAGTLVWNGAGSITVQILSDDPMAQTLVGTRCRATVSYLGVTILSGRVKPPSGSVLPGTLLSFTIKGDRSMLEDTVAWVQPQNPAEATSLSATDTSAIGQAWIPDPTLVGANGTVQGQSGYVLWPQDTDESGALVYASAESAAKWIVGANFSRLGRPVKIADSQRRGGDAMGAGILPDVRFSMLDEAIQPILDWSGLGFRILQQEESSDIVADVVVPGEWKQTLTPESGIVTDGTWSLGDIAATRGLLGGPGEDVARMFSSFVDKTGLERDFGYIVEVFKDATGANLQWPSTLADQYKIAKYFLLRSEVAAAEKSKVRAYFNTAANSALSDGAPKNSLAITLSETSTFHFGGTDGIQLGDKVSIDVPVGGGRLAFADRIVEVDIAVSSKGEVECTPIVGGRKDDPDRKLAEAIKTLYLAQRRLLASK